MNKTIKIKRLVAFIIPSLLLFFGCKGPSKDEAKEIEELVKIQLSLFDLSIEKYNSNYQIWVEQLEKGEITASGFRYYDYVIEAEKCHPLQILEDLRYFDNAIIEIKEDLATNATTMLSKYEGLVKKWNKNEDTSKLSEEEQKYLLNGRKMVYIDNLLKKIKNKVVVLSEFEPIKSSGKTEMYVFTELNSGYEFKAIINKDRIEINLTEKGEEKWEKAIAPALENINELYNDYQTAISEEKEKQEELQADIRRAFWGF